MLRLKEYLQESAAQSDLEDRLEFLDTFLENYDIEEGILTEAFDGKFTALKPVRDDIDKHMGNFLSLKKPEKQAAVSAAKDYFAKTDFRTIKEKAAGSVAAKERKANNAGKKPTHPNYKNEGNFESPLKVTPPFTSATKKHKSSGKDYVIPEGHGEKSGKGATVSGLRLTPGIANLGDGKGLLSCPNATKGCAGSVGDRSESGVHKDALCLAARGTDGFVNSRKAKLARTRALVSNPEARKHATVLLSHELESAHNAAKKSDSIHHFRPNDSSDIDLVTSPVNKHFKGIVTYGYSKHMAHDKNNPNNHVTRSDTGPEFNENNVHDLKQHKNKLATVNHLLGGKDTRAYMVMAQKRSKDVTNTDSDKIKHIHTVRYHTYDEHGHHTGHEDFDADRNTSNGDLRPYDKKAVRNTHSKDGKEKGAITLTDISGGKSSDISGTESTTSNSMVHPIDSDHVKPDENHPGKYIYHVDPPELRTKKHFKLHQG